MYLLPYSFLLISNKFCNGPQIAIAYRLDVISQGLSISRAQPPPTCFRNEYARIQNILHGAVLIKGA
jgi:hypothetical protein